jgi:2-haloacid dehalogenase
MPLTKPSVFIDLDNTILDFDWAERRALTSAFREVGLKADPELLARYNTINRLQWELLEDGVLTREQVLLRRFQILFEEKGIRASAAVVGERYEALLADGYRFLPGAEKLLRTLFGKYKLYLASNGSASVQEARIASSGIARFFDGIFISEELGADKPSKEYFDRCFARIPSFDPARALMVGDSLTSDIRGGINAGIRTCWYNPHERIPNREIRPDFEIRSLDELSPLLDRLFYQGEEQNV